MMNVNKTQRIYSFHSYLVCFTNFPAIRNTCNTWATSEEYPRDQKLGIQRARVEKFVKVGLRRKSLKEKCMLIHVSTRVYVHIKLDKHATLSLFFLFKRIVFYYYNPRNPPPPPNPSRSAYVP